jgi:hypothetical protein
LTLYSPTKGEAVIDRNSSIRVQASDASAVPRSGDTRGGQESSHLPTLENGALASGIVPEEDPGGPGSHSRLGPASQGEVKLRLHTESTKQVCSCLWLAVQSVVSSLGILCHSGSYGTLESKRCCARLQILNEWLGEYLGSAILSVIVCIYCFP